MNKTTKTLLSIYFIAIAISFIGGIIARAALPSAPNVRRVNCVYLDEHDKEKIYTCYENWDNARNKVKELDERLEKEGATKCNAYDSPYDAETLLNNPNKNYLYCDDQGQRLNCNYAELTGEELFRKYCLGKDYIDNPNRYGTVQVFKVPTPGALFAPQPIPPGETISPEKKKLQFELAVEEWSSGGFVYNSITSIELWYSEISETNETSTIRHNTLFVASNKENFEKRIINIRNVSPQATSIEIYAWISYIPDYHFGEELRRFATNPVRFTLETKRGPEEFEGEEEGAVPQYGNIEILEDSQPLSSGAEISSDIEYNFNLTLEEEDCPENFSLDSITEIQLWVKEGEEAKKIFTVANLDEFKEKKSTIPLSGNITPVYLYAWILYGNEQAGEEETLLTNTASFAVSGAEAGPEEFRGVGEEDEETGEMIPLGTVHPLTIKCTRFADDISNLIYCFLSKIIYLLAWMASILLTLMIIASGFLFITAGGNPEAITKAKNALIAAVIGAIITFSAWAIVIYIKGKLEEATTASISTEEKAKITFLSTPEELYNISFNNIINRVGE